jgi:hypothetical protein
MHSLARDRRAGQADFAAKSNDVGVTSEPFARLTGTKYTQDEHVAGSLVAAGVGTHSTQRPVSAFTGQLPHAGMQAE